MRWTLMSNDPGTLPSYDFDVAFSFLAADESLAQTLNDRLQGRMRTFIYSEQQKALAGKDGEQVFNTVFGEKSRFVVVLYRTGWGESPWTRIEMTAIRNRAHNEGHDFILLVPLDTPPTAPKWLPKQRIWIGLERWGVDGAAAVIEARVQELGGEPAVESVAMRAARLHRARDFEAQRLAFRDSAEGVKAAVQSFKQFEQCLNTAIAEAKRAGITLSLNEVRGDLIVHGLGPATVVIWDHRYVNTLEHTALRIEVCDRLPIGYRRIPAGAKHRTLERVELTFELVLPDRQCWIAQQSKREFTSQELVDEVLRRYMDLSETWKRPDDPF
jgi:hypothetical protein